MSEGSETGLARLNRGLDRLIAVTSPVAYGLAWIAGLLMVISAVIDYRLPVYELMEEHSRVAVFALGMVIWTLAGDAYRYTRGGNHV